MEQLQWVNLRAICRLLNLIGKISIYQPNIESRQWGKEAGLTFDTWYVISESRINKCHFCLHNRWISASFSLHGWYEIINKSLQSSITHIQLTDMSINIDNVSAISNTNTRNTSITNLQTHRWQHATFRAKRKNCFRAKWARNCPSECCIEQNGNNTLQTMFAQRTHKLCSEKPRRCDNSCPRNSVLNMNETSAMSAQHWHSTLQVFKLVEKMPRI